MPREIGVGREKNPRLKSITGHTEIGYDIISQCQLLSNTHKVIRFLVLFISRHTLCQSIHG